MAAITHFSISWDKKKNYYKLKYAYAREACRQWYLKGLHDGKMQALKEQHQQK